MKNILAITGSRADFAAIHPVAEALRGHEQNQVTETSLWNYLNIPDERASQAQQAGYIIHHINGAISASDPEIAILCGDRWEVLAAATACYMRSIPIAHLSGGDRTPFSADDKMRNAISMLASLHFPTYQGAAQELRTILGIDPGRIYSFGAPATDRIIAREVVSREAAFAPTMLEPNTVNVLVAIHPDTGPAPRLDVCGEVLAACDHLAADLEERVSFYLVSPNGDYGKSTISAKLNNFVGQRINARMLPPLTPEQYIDLLDHCDFMVGNSSSGVYEAPVLGVPSIIVGPRQIGRPKVAFGYAAADRKIIFTAMSTALSAGRVQPTTIFGKGDASQRIAAVIDRFDTSGAGR